MNSLPVILGDRIRNIRRERGLSQEELAHLSSLHSTYIGQIERGEKNITIESLEKVTNALNISLDELFRYIEPSYKDSDKFILNQIINKLQSKTLEQQKLLLKLIELLDEW